MIRMMRRFLAFCLVIVLATVAPEVACACNEGQSEVNVRQILFGDDAPTYRANKNARLLMDALYLCSEQSDRLGQDRIDRLQENGVDVPALSDINIEGKFLMEYSHNSWELKSAPNTKVESSRRAILKNTVEHVCNIVMSKKILNKIFKIFGSEPENNSKKYNSFSALLYYSHILSDYLASNPDNTATTVSGRVTSFTGNLCVYISGNKPSFTTDEKKNRETFIKYSPLDVLKRCGPAFANIDWNTLQKVRPQVDFSAIKPTGWTTLKYPEGFAENNNINYYNRCHLIAHNLGGENSDKNIITGTRYLNEGMVPFEKMIAKYVRETRNHVLYRVTPIFKKDNKLAHGVQMEAYSVEDEGKGICFNVYLYNVQPGFELNYGNGKGTFSDVTFGQNKVIPFVMKPLSARNPDLIHEMEKHLKILFDDPRTRESYNQMLHKIDTVTRRAVDLNDRDSVRLYIKLKEYEFKYFDILRTYVPLLLQKQDFFRSIF